MTKMLMAMVACLGLAACNDNDEKVYTVDELVNDQVTLTRIYKECGNDPGRLSETPNCKNAAQAQWKSRLKNMKDSLQ